MGNHNLSDTKEIVISILIKNYSYNQIHCQLDFRDWYLYDYKNQSEEFDLAYHRVRIILIRVAKAIQYIMEDIQSYDRIKTLPSMIFFFLNRIVVSTRSSHKEEGGLILFLNLAV